MRAAPGTTISLLREHFSDRPFRLSEAVERGASRSTLRRLRDSGLLDAPARGVLQLPGGGMGTWSSFAVVTTLAPAAIVCLNSALSYWDLTDEIPRVVHIAVPSGARLPAIHEPATKAHRFNARTFELGRQRLRTDAGEPFWMYSPERSVIDALRMARWLGRDVGLHALRRYINRPGAQPAQLTAMAREIGRVPQLQPALEALLS